MPISAPAQSSSALKAARSSLVIALLLFLGTLVLYLPVLNNGFVNYDDPAYVTANAHVLQGLSWKNIAWALGATVEANWHPLTWMSHMADVQVFGLNPRGHHLVSIVLHGLNVVLVFFILRRATGLMARSAIVAALFAVHPLNVECVAWIAERKSLLSMLFLVLALMAYGWYAEKRSIGRYAAVVALFALGLAAKPMIVMFPVLLLLWDYWPLGRWDIGRTAAGRRAWLRLLAEKIPLFALAAASSWITVYAQRQGGALGNMQLLPLRLRIANGIYSYAAYLGKGVWPSGLAVFYPHPEHSLATWKVVAAAFVMVVITVLCWVSRKRHRYLLTGWLWYLAAMIPMIGIVQVGRQAMADRYAYLPFLGLFVVAVWGGAELLGRLSVSTFAQAAISAAVLLAYASATFLQISYWRNSHTLFSHAVAVTSHNGIAEDNLGTALTEMGRPDLAAEHFRAAEEYMPQLPTAHYNLGILEQQQNHLEAARHEYELALEYTSDATEAAQSHNNLGLVLLDMNDPKDAVEQFSDALAINPEKQNSLLGRGMAEYRMGNLDGAIGDLSQAARMAPSAQADFWLGRAFEDRGDQQSAEKAYAAALQIAPDMAEARQRLDALRKRR